MPKAPKKPAEPKESAVSNVPLFQLHVMFRVIVSDTGSVFVEAIKQAEPDSPVFLFHYLDQPLNKHTFLKSYIAEKTIDLFAPGSPRQRWLSVVLSGAERLIYWSDSAAKFKFNEDWLLPDPRFGPAKYEKQDDPTHFVQRFMKENAKLRKQQLVDRFLELVPTEAQPELIEKAVYCNIDSLTNEFIQLYQPDYDTFVTSVCRERFDGTQRLADFVERKCKVYEGFGDSYASIYRRLAVECADTDVAQLFQKAEKPTGREDLLKLCSRYDRAQSLKKEMFRNATISRIHNEEDTMLDVQEALSPAIPASVCSNTEQPSERPAGANDQREGETNGDANGDASDGQANEANANAANLNGVQNEEHETNKAQDTDQSDQSDSTLVNNNAYVSANNTATRKFALSFFWLNLLFDLCLRLWTDLFLSFSFVQTQTISLLRTKKRTVMMWTMRRSMRRSIRWWMRNKRRTKMRRVKMKKARTARR